MDTVRNIIYFTLICLISPYLIGLAIGNIPEADSSLSQLSLLIPGLTVLGFYHLKFKKPILKNNDLGLNFKGLKYWIIAPVSITVLCLIWLGISILIHPELLKSEEDVILSLSKSGFYWGNLWIGLATLFLINMFLGILVNIPLYLGEELGWRAFLFPGLLRKLKPYMAFLLGGIIWGVWHLILIMQTIDLPDNPVPAIFLFIFLGIPIGILFQYFFYRSKSIAVAVLSYGALQKSILTSSFILSDKLIDSLCYGYTGWIGIVIFWSVALQLFKRIKWQNK